jgi:hypothetical protein
MSSAAYAPISIEQNGNDVPRFGPPERDPEKCAAVFRKIARQTNNLEQNPVSKKLDFALAMHEFG